MEGRFIERKKKEANKLMELIIVFFRKNCFSNLFTILIWETI